MSRARNASLPEKKSIRTPIELSVAPSGASSVEAALGTNVLAQYRITMDFPAQKIYLEPIPDSQKPLNLPGSPGEVLLKKQGSQIRIDTVLRGSAAYRAGLRNEDRLLAVDGLSVEGLSSLFIEDRVDGLSGTDAHLRIERAGQVQEIVYHRYSIVDKIVGASLGVEASMTEDYRMIVDRVVKGSAAQKAGLRKGDSILSINQLAVATTDNERLQSLLKNPPINPLVLTVQRKGAGQSEEIRLGW